MKYLKLSLFSLLAGGIATVALAAVTLLGLMAATPEVGQRAEGFFGAVFFETEPVDREAFTMSVGVASGWPLLISTLAIAGFVFVTVLIFRWLKTYRAGLLSGAA